MQSLLANVWRENSAYLRYADAKCALLLGLSGAFIASFLSHVGRVQGNDQSIFHAVQSNSLSLFQWVTLSFLCLSLALATLGVLPVVSRRFLRVRLALYLGQMIGIFDRTADPVKVVYYMDVARFDGSSKYCTALNLTSQIDLELGDQIWIVSRIASAKHILTLMSAFALLIGFSFAVTVG